MTACGFIAGASYNAEAARTYYSEAIVFVRRLDDRWSLSQILAWQANTGVNVGDPITARAAGEEGRDLADAIGDPPNSRICRLNVVFAQLMEGDVNGSRRGIPGPDRRVRSGSRRVAKAGEPDGPGSCTGIPG